MVIIMDLNLVFNHHHKVKWCYLRGPAKLAPVVLELADRVKDG